MNSYQQLQKRLKTSPKTWLITGVAGFIGSNLLETLLKLNQRVVGLDNFSTGHQRNLDEVQSLITTEQWANFNFIKGDIRNIDDCRTVMHYSPFPMAGQAAICQLACVDVRLVVPSEGRGEGEIANIHTPVDYVIHQAALGSVPRSIEDPILTNQNNIDGFLNMLVAARDACVKRFVYAASSSTYGDHPDLPKVEDKIGKPLSPYAVTKYVNELYAEVFARSYNFKTIGLRYFNIFGRRQDPDGAYAAVIPKWVASMIKNEPVYINGDGQTSRDFCYIDNAVQANLLAATVDDAEAVNQVYNVAVNARTNLNELFALLRDGLASRHPALKDAQPSYRDFRAGDVMHSQADIDKACRLLGYQPTHTIGQGLKEALVWYEANG